VLIFVYIATLVENSRKGPKGEEKSRARETRSEGEKKTLIFELSADSDY